jgi:hypothetical protein
MRVNLTPLQEQDKEAFIRNIHFYINKCGFHMVEFFCKAHPEPDVDYTGEAPGPEGFCRFEKRMK